MLESTLEHNICTDSPISISEVKNCIKEMKSGKSAGPDLISNEIIKCSSIVTVTAIVKLFNLILSSGIYPTSWRKAFIVLIRKSGDKEDICNYRDVEVTGGRVDGGLGTDFPIHGQYEPLMTEFCEENLATFKNFVRIVPNMFQELLHVVGPRITKNNTWYRQEDE
ncbi:unnamed protein product [Mytilus coruscus]|uniref:Reverse transcriptase domain-containing protein n=1 Tax=Mytilus coruscus TaxID=42192 RepID=A0A6J8DM29_MYTCO|nr:unnamed protein product [Mytilus coruscus]